jgi:HAMP domain-containing protein
MRATWNILKNIRSIVFKTRQALVLALLLSFSAMQVFAMTMPVAIDLNPAAAAQQDCAGEHAQASPVLMMSQMVELSDVSHSDHACGENCIADHCLMSSAVTVSAVTIELSGSLTEVASGDVSADSIDTFPPYYPPDFPLDTRSLVGAVCP